MAASVEHSHEKDLPSRLSLSAEPPAGSSPFPSPSSTFLPPPIPGAHEFANKPPNNSRFLRKKSIPATLVATSPDGDSSTEVGESTEQKESGAEMVNSNPSAIQVNGNETVASLTTLMSAITPTAPTAVTPTVAKHAHSPSSSLNNKSQPAVDLSSPDTPSRRISLNSTRPAPPSPTPSRRASAALSVQRQSSLRHSTNLSHASGSTPYIPPPLKIRDFAFPDDDPRHIGAGPDAPKPKPWPNRDSTSSVSSTGSGWSGRLKFGFGSFGWGGFGSGSSSRRDSRQSPWNTSSSSPVQYADEPQIDDDNGDEQELLPGIYRAMYAFEPEGTAEMALVEDQLVRVVGRGGGVGWAVVEKDESEGGGHALVPESYLELVELDDES